MATPIPDLWPDYVSEINVVSPAAIMRHQAGLLRLRTKNLLEAEVRSSGEDDEVVHEFWIIAPGLNRYAYQLFTARHQKDQAFPVVVQFEPLQDFDGYAQASSQSEFTALLQKVFNHSVTKSVIHSLIAQINDSHAQKSDSGGDDGLSRTT